MTNNTGICYSCIASRGAGEGATLPDGLNKNFYYQYFSRVFYTYFNGV